MAKGILYVQTHVDPAQADAYHAWYNDEHLPEICNLEGIVSARRFEPIDEDGSFTAIYEIDADSVEATKERLFAFMGSGKMSTPAGMAEGKPFVMSFMREIASHP